MKIDRILVVIEPDAEVQAALDKAGPIGKAAGAELELILAEHSPYLEDGYYFDPVQAQKLRQEHNAARQQELELLADHWRQQGLKVDTLACWGKPEHTEIVNRARDTQPDLVVSATRHHNKVARLLLSNEDWELVRYCPVPLLLVKDKPWPAKAGVIAAVDPDHAHDKPAALDHKLIEAAKVFAGLGGGKTYLYHSIWLPPLAGMYSVEADGDAETAKLTALANEHGIAGDACHWSRVEITDSLPKVVSETEAAVIVMGAVSRSRLDRLLIGNTAERILDHVECDVLVVKPDEIPALNTVLI